MSNTISANSTSLWLESIMNRLGYSMEIAPRFIFLLLVPSILGSLSETACCLVFFYIKLGSPLYTYLRAYTINNLFTCFSLFFQFFYSCYFFGDRKTVAYVNSYLFLVPQNVCYVFGTLLDILILLERISTFNRRVKQLLKVVPPYKQVVLLALISIVLCIPNYILFGPETISVISPNKKTYIIWLSGRTKLGYLDAGRIVGVLSTAINYGVVMTIQIALNIRSLFYIRKHLKEKTTIMSTIQIQNRNFQNVDIKMSLMVSILCFISFVEHVLIMIGNVGGFYFASRINIFLYRNVVLFFFGIRRFLDFFLYFYFNKVFKAHFLLAFGMRQDSQSHSGNQVVLSNRAA